MIGKTIAHYKILEEIGSGGMGIVYKAEDTKLKRTVALKFLPPEFTRDKEAKTRFMHEAQAASALEHNNICNIHEINETDDGRMFIAMAYYEGETLKDKIEKGPLKTKEAIDLVLQIAEGLHEAHEKKIIHRDIKSANIIVTEKGQVKILDFGLAKLKGHTRLTKESTTLGTIAYMSPEQTTGEAVDHRSDIWSLGVVFYEMLTGQLPFRGHYEQAIIYSIMNEDPQPLKELIPEIPEQIEQIIFKMLAKDPSQRYPDLGAFLEDIKRFKKGKELKEISLKPEFRIMPKFKSLVVGFILIVAIVAFFLIFKGKPAPDIPPIEPGSMPSLAVVYFENISGDKNLDNWRQAFSELLTTDLAQSRYMKVLRSDEVYGIFKQLNLLEAERYSTQELQEVARNGKVNHVLKGSYIKAGNNFVITAMLINASSGETISSLSVRAEGEKNIFPKVDELTREIKSKLELTQKQIDADIDKEVGQIITSSPEAFDYYMKSEQCWNNREFQKVIRFLEKAIEIDPEFAFAYHDMAFAYYFLGNLPKYNEFMKKALQFSHRLPDRERYMIEASYYRSSPKTRDKAMQAYQRMLQLYPFDPTANNQLGIMYEGLEEWDKAIDRYEVLIQNKCEFYPPYLGIAACYQSKGLYEKARDILEHYLKHFEDHRDIHLFLAGTHCIKGNFDQALIETEKAITLAPKFFQPLYMKANIFYYQGKWNKAEKIYQKLLQFPRKLVQLGTLHQFGYIHMTRGQFKQAEAIFKQARTKAKEMKWDYWEPFVANDLGYVYFFRRMFDESLTEFNQCLANINLINTELHVRLKKQALYFRAMAYLEKQFWGQVQKAEVELLEYLNQSMNKKFIRWYYLFQGQKELKKNNIAGAIEYFKRAISLLGNEIGAYYDFTYHYQPLFFDALARAYLESGDLEKAQDQFQKIIALTVERIRSGDLYARAFYELGKIYQQQGKKDKAKKNFNKFINLWKNCDPIFQPLVKDARKRVGKLAPSKKTNNQK